MNTESREYRLMRMRQIIASFRRFTRVNTKFGVVPMPMESYSTVILPFNTKIGKFNLLPAQSSMLNEVVSLEQVSQIWQVLQGFYSGGWLRTLHNVISWITLLLFTISFVLLFIFVVVSRSADLVFFGYSLIVYIAMVILLYITSYVIEYCMTKIIRGWHQKAVFFLGKLNYALDDKPVFFSLGMNMLWLEIHILEKLHDDIEVNISKVPRESAKIRPFQLNLTPDQFKPVLDGKNDAELVDFEEGEGVMLVRVASINKRHENNEKGRDRDNQHRPPGVTESDLKAMTKDMKAMEGL